MSRPRRALGHPDAETLAAGVAARMAVTIMDVLAEQHLVHVVLTGGPCGTAGLAALARQPLLRAVDFSRVHVWWTDERFLPEGHPARNETRAREAMQGVVALPPTHVHAMPAALPGLSPDDAADRYSEELAAFGHGAAVPPFDLLLLSIGPDGHIASLYPEAPELAVADRSVVVVQGAPDPAPIRLSLTMPTLRSARRLWLLASGGASTDAVRTAWEGVPDASACPASGAEGLDETLLLTDAEAGAGIGRGN